MIAAIIAAFLNPIEIIGTKEIFKRERVNYKAFLSLTFFFIFIFCAIAFISFGQVSASFFAPKYFLYLIAIVTVAYFSNRLFYFGLSGEKVCNVEPISMLSPVIAVVLAAMVYPDERNWKIFIIALIGGLALSLSRIEKHHLKFDKYSWAILAAVFLSAFDSIFAKHLLEVLSPVALYTIRCGILSLLLVATLKPNMKVFGKKRILSIAGVSFVITLEVFGYYQAIHSIGIVKTSLIFLLAPVLVLLASRFYLKEKIKLKAVIADIVIVLCIAASIFV